jgi:D-arabinose 1-dehydrogenase-like Zn-dependent alcohol dehydrogenase
LLVIALADTNISFSFVACGVCHSDLHVINGDQPYPIPVVLGHEITGEVVEHGPHTDQATRNRLVSPGQLCFL